MLDFKLKISLINFLTVIESKIADPSCASFQYDQVLGKYLNYKKFSESFLKQIIRLKYLNGGTETLSAVCFKQQK